MVILHKYCITMRHTLVNMTNEAGIDALDARLIELLEAEPRIGVLECSRRLGVARGTVQARLDKLTKRAVVRDFGPRVEPAALGYPVTAFVTLELRQAVGHERMAQRLAKIPEVLEAHTVTGQGDMLCRIVARTNAELQGVIDRVLASEGVQRATTVIALAEQIPYRTLPLVKQAAGEPTRPIG
jgi:DNA-binding Lrp family transcriptional regulator